MIFLEVLPFPYGKLLKENLIFLFSIIEQYFNISFEEDFILIIL